MKSALFFVILFSFVLVSCSPGTITNNYYTGHNGLVISFVDDAPPDEVVEGFPAYLAVEVQNLGAYTIDVSNPGLLSVVTDQFYLQHDKATLPDGSENVFLLGKSLGYPTGEKQIYNLGLLRPKKYGPIVAPETQISVNLCYPYKTYLAEQVCVDLSAGDPNDDRVQVCEPTPLSLSGGQGAPVGIVSVDSLHLPYTYVNENVPSQDPVYDEHGNLVGTTDEYTTTPIALIMPVFRFTIKNFGNGMAINASGEATCQDTIAYTPYWNTFDIVAHLGKTRLVCSPDAVRFIDDTATISCFVPPEAVVSGKSNYYDLLSVELEYRYFESVAKKVRIVDLTDREYVPDGTPIFDDPAHGDPRVCNYYEERTNDNQCISKCEFCNRFPNTYFCPQRTNPGTTYVCTTSTTYNECLAGQSAKTCAFNFCPEGSYCVQQ
ncbi:MAG: hypothetical protein H6502_05160 [Candidatus Woesearchaeota archaeon]|nr:MAG: hypothetical protein H6502_05160 [Candidatus Woesearchaeota archaeon]